MGANQSTQETSPQTAGPGPIPPGELRFYINQIATKFILSKSFQRIKDLTNENTCNDLIILTSDLVSKYLDDAQIEFLTQHLGPGGQVVDKKNTERLVFFDKADAQGENPPMGVQSRTKKTRMCIGIAQFYVKIFNLFSAVATTVNPQLAYTDPKTGKRAVVSILDKNSIPAGVDTRPVSTSFCSKRVSALFGDSVSGTNAGEDVITIRPGICSLNESSSTQYPSLENEPGMPELANLFNDKYNYATGKFDAKSPAAEKAYLEAVQMMYRVFTGNQTVPSTVISFKDIPLAQYWRTPVCDKRTAHTQSSTRQPLQPTYIAQPGPSNVQISFPMPQMSGQYNLGTAQVGGSPATGAYRQTYTGSTRIAAYSNYAKHVSDMMKQTAAREKELLGVLKEVFSTATDPTGREDFNINPSLTHDSLDKIIASARAQIGAYYAECEQNFQKGVDLLEAVVQYQYTETSRNRGADLRQQLDNLRVR